MLKNYNVIEWNENSEYPDKSTIFRPAEKYPEYPFDEVCERNDVYEMVRDSFRLMGLDVNNYGKETWNPLGEIIQPSNTVLIKPNMVYHENGIGYSIDCMATHPSVVSAVVDYAWIALKGIGKIIIGDAPVQECFFDELVSHCGYDDILNYYKEKGVHISLCDFRNIKIKWDYGVHFPQEKNKQHGIDVILKEESAFDGFSDEDLSKLRVTNFDPRIMEKSHKKGKHIYTIAKDALSADVIINMPKPKTHRKAGLSISMKNMIGVCASKESLPHHMLGSKEEGGDAYQNKNENYSEANRYLDKRNIANEDGCVSDAVHYFELSETYKRLGDETDKIDYWEGSWYGNDTIWRTIHDINKIILYANSKGELCDTVQRKMFIVADMIISGEKEGPINPDPVHTGIIAIGSNNYDFDSMVCNLMGFDTESLPFLNNKKKLLQGHSIIEDEARTVISNNELWNNQPYGEIRRRGFKFYPSYGWQLKMGNPNWDKTIEKVRLIRRPLYIFGAGKRGIYIYSYIKERGVEIQAFVDNDKNKWGTTIADGVTCISPHSADLRLGFIISVGDYYWSEVFKQLRLMGVRKIFSMHEE